jgi:ABC-type multidrug transport system ATPase subunit
MLCFDPTRGIDIRTKNQIYVLLRDLADAGAAVLLYTSELKEVQLVCDRAIVIFGGRVVAEIAAADADEAALLRAAYNLRSDAQMPEEIVATAAAAAEAEQLAGDPVPTDLTSAPPASVDEAAAAAMDQPPGEARSRPPSPGATTPEDAA